MQPASERSRTFSRRALLLLGGKAVLLSALVGRMYELQVVDSSKYKLLADENRISIRRLPPPRARILARCGVPRAINAQTYRVVVVPEQTPSLEATREALARLIPISDSTRAEVLHESRFRRAFVPVVVKENLSWD